MKQKNDGSENTTIGIKNDSMKSQCEDITNKNKFYVYALIDPSDNLPFYIGKGKNARDTSHIRETTRGIIPHGNKHLYYSIKQILDSGKLVIVERWDTQLEESVALAKEVEYIKKYGRRDLGTGILTNLTDGGEGTTKLVISEERRKKYVEIGRKLHPFGFGNDESRRKVSESHKRTGHRPPKPNWKIRKNPMLGNTHTNEARKKMSDARKKYTGKKHPRYRDLEPYKDTIIQLYKNRKNLNDAIKNMNSVGIKIRTKILYARLKEWNVT